MESTNKPPAIRHDGWTDECKGRFLALLAESGNVQRSARRCGMSAQSAYVLRRREGEFALGWDAALVLARDHAEQVLADRAIEGVEEPIFYRGEQVGSRLRFDARLLLAHLARLDRLAEDPKARRAAGRFDELVAAIAGCEPPPMPGWRHDEDGFLPPTREAFASAAMVAAQDEADEALPEDMDTEERNDAVISAARAARDEAEIAWDSWLDAADALVDGLAGDRTVESISPDTVNSVNFAGDPGRGLTLAAASPNGSPRSVGSLADHPSETVGASSWLNFQPRRGNEFPGLVPTAFAPVECGAFPRFGAAPSPSTDSPVPALCGDPRHGQT